MQVNGNGTQSLNRTDENDSSRIRRGRREEEGQREGKKKKKQKQKKRVPYPANSNMFKRSGRIAASPMPAVTIFKANPGC